MAPFINSCFGFYYRHLESITGTHLLSLSNIKIEIFGIELVLLTFFSLLKVQNMVSGISKILYTFSMSMFLTMQSYFEWGKMAILTKSCIHLFVTTLSG